MLGMEGKQGPKGERGEAGAVGPRGEQGPTGKLSVVRAYVADAVSYQGDVVTWQGETWQALLDTGVEPSRLSSRYWACLAVKGRDAVAPKVRGTFDVKQTYAALDIVALDGGGFIARRDDPGPARVRAGS